MNQWISVIFCVLSGGWVVGKSQGVVLTAVKPLVRGDFYTHRPVQESIFRNLES
jgi:hypothetical protein